MLDEQIDDGAETLNSGFESEPVVASGARTPRWTKRWVKSDSGPAGPCVCVRGAAALCTVERVGERLDVRRVPGFEPVQDSTKTSRTPHLLGKSRGSAGQNGSEMAGRTRNGWQYGWQWTARPKIQKPGPGRRPAVTCLPIGRTPRVPVRHHQASPATGRQPALARHPLFRGERYERRRWSITCLFPLG